MSEAIGQTLALALGIALFPVPVITVILLLVTPRARANGPAFVLGWLAGLALVGVVALAVASPAGDDEGGGPATWVGLLKLGLGLLLLVLAVGQWRSRPATGEELPLPGWMRTIDAFTPLKSLGAGAALSAANPKNLLLAAAAAATIAETGIPAGEQAVAYAVFALVASLGVAAPVVAHVALGERAGPLLDRLKAWLGVNSAVIMAVLFLVLGTVLVGDGIAALGA